MAYTTTFCRVRLALIAEARTRQRPSRKRTLRKSLTTPKQQHALFSAWAKSLHRGPDCLDIVGYYGAAEPGGTAARSAGSSTPMPPPLPTGPTSMTSMSASFMRWSAGIGPTTRAMKSQAWVGRLGRLLRRKSISPRLGGSFSILLVTALVGGFPCSTRA